MAENVVIVILDS